MKAWSFRSVGAVLVVALVAPLGSAPPARAVGPCDPPITNVIVCENSLPGAPPGSWQVSGSGDSGLQGFATQMSVDKGTTVTFKITSVVSYHFDIVRLGWYRGNGARFWATNLTPSAPQPQIQPACLTNASIGLVDCGNWAPSASWAVPATAVSGVYLAVLRRDDTGGASQIPFVVRDDASHSDIVVQTSDSSWQAYNKYGGYSLYSGPGHRSSISQDRSGRLQGQLQPAVHDRGGQQCDLVHHQ